MVLDTSALVALLSGEPEAARLASAIESDPARRVSAATLLETGIVIEARYGPDGTRELELLLVRMQAAIEPFTAGQAALAVDAWRRFGKGRHPAGLNLGDCASYALARDCGEPLLFKGEDFRQTDIAAASY